MGCSPGKMVVGCSMQICPHGGRIQTVYITTIYVYNLDKHMSQKNCKRKVRYDGIAPTSLWRVIGTLKWGYNWIFMGV